MGEYEDAVQALRDAGLEDEAERFEQFSGSNLRKKAERTGELEDRIQELERENRSIKAVPKREAAFKAAGVDFEALSPLEREFIQNFQHEGDEPTKDQVSEAIEKYGFQVSQPDETETVEPPAAAGVTQQARTATERKLGGKITVSPEDTTQWSTEKILGFREKYPEEFEALKRGETVVAPA